MMLTMRRIVLAALAVALLLLTGCMSQPSPDPAEPINPPTASSTPSPSTSSGAKDVIRFDQGDDHELFIEKASDVEKLTGTSAEFKAFIADQVANLTPPAGATDCAIGVGVAVYDPSGFARGGVNACGGYAALWGIQDGKWKELIGTQDLWACADLRKYKVPSTMADTCYESMKEVPYKG
jgi:hypothetical protein